MIKAAAILFLLVTAGCGHHSEEHNATIFPIAPVPIADGNLRPIRCPLDYAEIGRLKKQLTTSNNEARREALRKIVSQIKPGLVMQDVFELFPNGYLQAGDLFDEHSIRTFHLNNNELPFATSDVSPYYSISFDENGLVTSAGWWHFQP